MTARSKTMTGADLPVTGLTVAAGVARSLIEFAVRRGASRAALLARAGIAAADLEHQERRIALRKHLLLMRSARELCADPALALHFGEHVDIAAMSIVGFLDQGVETVADAFTMINRYADLVMETGAPPPRMRVERRGAQVWIVDTRPHANASPEVTESAFARLVCGARRFFGHSRDLVAVHVTHPQPDYGAEYARIFAAPVVFGSDTNALVYRAAFWAQRITGGIAGQSPYVSAVLGAHADHLLHELQESRSTRGRIERLLAARLEGGDLSMAAVAGELGLTRPTLRRRLKTEGLTFAGVLDDLRRRTALECLRGARLSVNASAYRVGFSDPAPFSRAFKRWTGLSPSAFRASLGEGHAGREVRPAAGRRSRSRRE